MPQKDPKSMQSLQDEEKTDLICPDCKGKETKYEEGERYCKKCGYVFE